MIRRSDEKGSREKIPIGTMRPRARVPVAYANIDDDNVSPLAR